MRPEMVITSTKNNDRDIGDYDSGSGGDDGGGDFDW